MNDFRKKYFSLKLNLPFNTKYSFWKNSIFFTFMGLNVVPILDHLQNYFVCEVEVLKQLPSPLISISCANFRTRKLLFCKFYNLIILVLVITRMNAKCTYNNQAYLDKSSCSTVFKASLTNLAIMSNTSK